MSLQPSKYPTGYRIYPIPAFHDNYLWLICRDKQAVVVDPGDALPVLETLEKLGLNLTTILVTHHHPDHTSGISSLKEQTGANIIGPNSNRIPQIEQNVRGGEKISVLDLQATVIEVPGHTLDHIAYYFPDIVENDLCAPRLFCGDTLFAGGCGRLFEGTPSQMRSSLEKLRTLPLNTRVYCAHEYTLSNLSFSAAVEPDNTAIAERLSITRSLRARNQPTVPSVLEEELQTNPFLRFDQTEVIRAAELRLGNTDPGADEVFGAIRQWKDSF